MLLSPSNVQSQQTSADAAITAGVYLAFPPYLQSGENNRLEGFTVDVLAELSKLSGLKITIKEMPDMATAIKALRSGEIDIIPGFGISKPRQKYLSLTRPVETFRISLFVKNNSSTITRLKNSDKKSIGVVKGHTAQRILEKRHDIELAVYANPSSALIALLSGKIDALAQPEPVLWHIAKIADLTKYLKIVGDPIAVIERGIAVKSQNTTLLLKLNSAIEKMAISNAYTNIYAKWFIPEASFLTSKTVSILIGSVLLAGLILMGIWRYLTALKLNKELSRAITHCENLTDELTLSGKAYRSLYQSSPYAYVTCNADDFSIQHFNPAFSAILGYQDEDITALTLIDVCAVGANGSAKVRLLLERFKGGGVVRNEEIELKRKDGQSIWANFSLDQIVNQTPKRKNFRAALIDVTDRKMAENILRESEIRFKDFANAAADRFWETDSEHRYSYLSGPSGQVNAPYESLIGKCPWEIDHRNLSSQTMQDLIQLFKTRSPFRGRRQEWTNSIGNKRTVSMNGIPIWDEAGAFKGYRGTTIDITEQVEAQERSADNRRKLIDALDSAAEEVILWDADDCMVLCNEIYRQTHSKVGDILRPGLHFTELIEKLADKYVREDREEWIAEEFAWHKNPPDSYEQRRDDQYYLVHKSRLEDGSTISFHTNITDLKQREFALKESEARFSKIFQASPNLQSITDIETGKIVDVNDVWLSSLKFTRDQVIGKNAEELGMAIDFTNESRKEMIARIKHHGPAEKFEAKLITADGEERIYLANADIIELGGVNHLLLVSDDITSERQIAEELHQAQKMEAVGQLTGGIAHDFNNILSSVLGNLELMSGDPKNTENVIGYVERAKKSVLRAADLTKRLLVFSRKQTLNSKSIDLNTHIPGILAVIERTLGESITISFDADPELSQCLVDLKQLDNALVNFAINARDAMPNGGKLSIEIADKYISDEYAANYTEVEPGDYVNLTISDTGDGIAPANLEHVIEPFFTTKDVGQGSGLGLSMVYGFIKQSGGFLSIESELGVGTSVQLYIPRSENLENKNEGTSELQDLPLGQGEAILVIEDDPEVREVAISTLEHLGYASIDGGDGTKIKEFTDRHSGHLDLILADMILPDGLTGISVTDEILDKFPEVKIIFITGYTDSKIIEKNTKIKKYPVVGKPFEADTLARTIYDTLHS